MNRLAVALLAILALYGCSKREDQKQTEEAVPVAQPGAVATFIKGQVQTFSSGVWKATVINDRLLLSDSLEMAAGSELELAPDSVQAIKLSGPLKGAVGELIEKARQSTAAPISKASSAIKKVQGAKQTLTTQTPTAVAGIRGTAGRRELPPDSTQADSASQ